MSSIETLPQSLLNDLVAMWVKTHGTPREGVFPALIDGHFAELQALELRTPLDAHRSLPAHYILDVSLDPKTEEIVLTWAPTPEEAVAEPTNSTLDA